MSSKQLILVTGINGFLGAHIVDQLVKAGYRVRGTVRSAKLDTARQSNASYGTDVEVIAADDLAYGDFTDALKGVHGVIHAAAPLVGRDSPENALTAAIEGALNILRQVEKAGIKRFTLVSSIVTVGSANNITRPWTDNDWVAVSREEALTSKDPNVVYVTEKTLAERAVWELAEKHPHVDVTTVNPPFFIGPFAPNFRFSDALIKELSTNLLFYELLKSDGTFPSPALLSVDVRDVARATVLSLTAPARSAAPGERKRLLLFPHAVSWKDVAEYVVAARPELKDRISKAALSGQYPHPAPPNPVDNTKTLRILGLEPIDWKTAVLDAVDSYIEVEKKFAKEGKTFH
ncbi:NAD-P-binding protein [Trametes polyzona]|nr:NAD-P-binding protein [Trametes polyzona]